MMKDDNADDSQNVSELYLERKKRLQELGFFDVEAIRRERVWEENFELLKQYKLEYGDCKYLCHTLLSLLPEQFLCLVSR